MAKEAKVETVHFSLPYRAGMETEPSYVGKVEMVQKGHPQDKVFAKFAVPLDKSIVIPDADALAFGRKALAQNKQRGPAIGIMAGKYGIAVIGAAPGGITKTDEGLIRAMGDVLPVGLDETYTVKRTGDKLKGWQGIQLAFKNKTQKEITEAKIKEILAK